MAFPYNFVPVNSDLTIKDSPSDHLCLELDKNCGEINLTITTLTPTICGHFQTEYGSLSEDAKNEIDKNKKFNSKKHVIEPLIINGGNGQLGPVLIPSTSIKGMIRQSVSSLLSAPMSKVEEKQYSYRPNLSPDIKGLVAAFILNKNKDGSRNILTCKMEDFYFCREAIKDSIKAVIQDEEFGPVSFLNNAKKEDNKFCNKIMFSKDGKIEFEKGKALIGKYHSGLDGKGVLAALFNKENESSDSKSIYPKPAYCWGILNHCDPKSIKKIPASIIKHFYKSLNNLIKENREKITKQNKEEKPKVKVSLEKTLTDQVEAKLKKGDIVFLELRAGDTELKADGSNIVSMGFNFRYRWMYRDSVLNKKGVLRKEIFDLSKEEFDKECGIPKETNMQRSLFGFVDDESKNSLSGRISPNCAIEQIDNKTNDERFVKHNESFYFVLKPLSSPKPSAVEMYLTQKNIDKRQDQGIVCTYGDTLDDESAGNLKGRKGYLHQSSCRTQSSYLNNPREDSYLSDQSSIVGYVSKPETIFKSKIRFQNLADWELGALIMSISPKTEYVKIIADKIGFKIDSKYLELTNSKDSNYFAQKIGHGRPLGLGSISCKVYELNLLKQNENEIIDFNKQENINKYIEDFADMLNQKLQDKKHTWFKQILIPWLKIRKYANTQIADYFKGEDNKIYNYHTQIRRDHCKGRKKAGKPRLSEKILPNL